MYSFSESSQMKLSTCHKDIVTIMNELIKYYDVTILEGHRSLATQVKYYKEGKSTLDGINKKSKHQSFPSNAIDIMPYANGTNAFSGKESDNRRFYFMMGMVKAIADRLLKDGTITHKVRFGLDWDGDNIFSDQTFHDLPHMEIYE